MKWKIATGSLIVVGALLATTSPSAAATGRLNLYGRVIAVSHLNPAPGCYKGTGEGTTVENKTDSPLLLFPDGNCTTKVYWPVKPGETTKNRNVGSVRVLK
ncbi:hypothetical protein [Spongiactinospora sp. TRM90649]|uniref:hypothetical protein n=1 Tax=Spongiactinospora sp. TRM90649 TaxID=3031114 RepID=UPI0023F9AF71|nr:hypothetical protein [Spongiactinospora sp. TRM90649]MDF5752880.1 hypothetical protein [Spongiactinospora sp. TRM90649]